MDARRDDDEHSLVEGLLRGSDPAVDDFLTRTHRPVYRMACRLTRDDGLRQDWTHDTLLGVLSDLRSGRFVYTRPGCFWAWFRKRANYRLLDCLRRERIRSDREHAHGDALDPRAPVSASRSADDRLADVEIRAAFDACLSTLTNDRHRQAIVHLLDHEMSYDEIARHMAAPLNTVRAWIRRGRLALRRCLVERLDLALPEEDSR